MPKYSEPQKIDVSILPLQDMSKLEGFLALEPGSQSGLDPLWLASLDVGETPDYLKQYIIKTEPCSCRDKRHASAHKCCEATPS
jgi:hypothetical protein